MKTKNVSSALRDKSSESWRTLEKGKVSSAKKTVSEETKFRVAGYVRISPTNEEREEGSLVSHPQRIENFIEDKNRREAWGEIVEWYIDKDYSGKDTNRPAFQKMMADIERKKINAVIVTEVSRLSRSVKDFSNTYEFFKAHKVAFFSLRDNFDTSTPTGELMLMQMIAFAQFERHTIVDRIKRGARARAERGLGNGTAALGFSMIEHKPNHREINPEEQPYVEMIFRKMLELKRIAKVIDYLNENGYRTREFTTQDGRKSGGNRWTVSSLYNIFTNRAYIGQREYNKKNRAVDPNSLKEDERYFFVDAQWPALVSNEIFEDVQALLVQNKKKARKYIHQYRLTGLVRCSECGEVMTGKSATGRTGKYFYYGHQRKMRTVDDRHLHRCAVENVSAIQLEEAVIARLRELANDRPLIEELALSTVKEARERAAHQNALFASQDAEKKRVQQKIANLMEAVADEGDKTLRAGLTAKLRELQVQFEMLEASVLQNQGSDTGNVADVSSVFTLLKSFRKDFEKADVSVQAEVLKDVVAGIEVQKDGIQVRLFGLNTENPSKKRAATNRSPVRSVFKLVETFLIMQPPEITRCKFTITTNYYRGQFFNPFAQSSSNNSAKMRLELNPFPQSDHDI